MTVPESWGRYPRSLDAHVAILPSGAAQRRDRLDAYDTPVLAFGRGRSYGDVCLNDGGWLLDTRRLDNFIAWNEDEGLLTVEAGVTLAAILDVVATRGWFLPVVPGTEQVTVGGAIANDVHGKNHHRDGSFGAHVVSLDLARSDRDVTACGPDHEPELFRATIGGLGLTGLILAATIRLRRIPSAWIDVETIPFATLDECCALSAASERDWQYTVAWADWRAKPDARGRGLFLRGNHAPAPPKGHQSRTGNSSFPSRRRPITIPSGMPGFLLNDVSLRLFNSWHFHSTAGRTSRTCQPYRDFFFPLDVVGQWNRLYGSRGFLQYQCVLPMDDGIETARAIFQSVIESETGSYLTVIKTFGTMAPAGVLSFPRPGLTIALDFPNTGDGVFRMCERLDALVRSVGGAVYPAKDARMSAESFTAFYPQAASFAPWRDPAFSSSFWRRVTTRRVTAPQGPAPQGNATRGTADCS